MLRCKHFRGWPRLFTCVLPDGVFQRGEASEGSLFRGKELSWLRDRARSGATHGPAPAKKISDGPSVNPISARLASASPFEDRVF